MRSKRLAPRRRPKTTLQYSVNGIDSVSCLLLLAVEESVGRIMGKRPAGHFGQAHAARTLRLSQEESRVVLHRAFGRRRFAQRTHGQKAQSSRELRPPQASRCVSSVYISRTALMLSTDS